MKLSPQSQNRIEEAIKTALAHYPAGNDLQQIITDIHLQPRLEAEESELVIMDDDDHVLAQTSVDEWTENRDDETCEDIESTLRNVLKRMKEKGMLDNTSLMKPYSFTLIDDHKETVAELLLVDDDTLLLNDGELLKGLDKELDAFLKELLEK